MARVLGIESVSILQTIAELGPLTKEELVEFAGERIPPEHAIRHFLRMRQSHAIQKAKRWYKGVHKQRPYASEGGGTQPIIEREGQIRSGRRDLIKAYLLSMSYRMLKKAE